MLRGLNLPPNRPCFCHVSQAPCSQQHSSTCDAHMSVQRASSKHAAAGKKPMPPKTAPANTKSPVQAGRGIVASALQSFEPSRRDSPDDDAAEGLLADVSDNLAAHVATAPSVAGRVQKKLAVVHALSKQKEVPRYMQPLRQSREDSARLAASSEWREPSADDILRWAKEHGRGGCLVCGVAHPCEEAWLYSRLVGFLLFDVLWG